MSFISELADRMPSGSPQTRTRLLSITGIVFILLLTAVGPAVAQNVDEVDSAGSDFLCDGGNSADALVGRLQNFMLLFVVGGPALGTTLAGFYTVAAAGQPDNDSHIKNRKKSLVAGWSVPFLIYGGNLLGDVVLGIDFSCIIP